MNLYVWTNFAPDYTGGLAFAVAKSLKEARKLIQKRAAREVGLDMYATDLAVKPKIHRLTSQTAYFVAGGG